LVATVSLVNLAGKQSGEKFRTIMIVSLLQLAFSRP